MGNPDRCGLSTVLNSHPIESSVAPLSYEVFLEIGILLDKLMGPLGGIISYLISKPDKNIELLVERMRKIRFRF